MKCWKSKKRYSKFFSKYALLHVAEMLHKEMKVGDDRYRKLAEKINIKKIKSEYQSMAKDEQYKEIVDKLYVLGYQYGVPGLSKYMSSNSVKWSIKMYEYIISDSYVDMWRRQISMSNLDKTEQKISSVYNKLIVLDNTESGLERANDAMITMKSAFLTLAATNINYHEENRKLFKDIFENIINGGVINNDIEPENSSENNDNSETEKKPSETEIKNSAYKVFKKLTALYGNYWIEQIVDAMNSMKTFSQNTTTILTEQVQQAGIKLSGENLKIFGQVLALCVTVAATIYVFVSDEKLSATQITDIFVSSTKAILQGSVRVLDRLFFRFGNTLPGVLKNLGAWASGVLKPSRCVQLIFGENGKVFLACRLGAVLMFVTVIISIVDIYKNISKYDKIEIAIKSISVAFMGLAAIFTFMAASFPAFGAVATVLCLVSFVVMIFEIVYQCCKPVKPPENAVTKFVNETLKEKGYLLA